MLWLAVAQVTLQTIIYWNKKCDDDDNNDNKSQVYSS